MPQSAVRMDRAGLEKLVTLLRERGYDVYAPVKDGPEGGWKPIDSLEPMELKGPPPQGPKRLFHLPKARLVTIERENGSWRVQPEAVEGRKIALFGVHACDVGALTRLDRVLAGDRFKDAQYANRRKHAIVVAFNCTESVDTCFCTSMDCGPAVKSGFDIAITPAGGGDFLAESGTKSGVELIKALGDEPAEEAWAAGVRKGIEKAAVQSRKVDRRKAPALLDSNRESPRWTDTAKRCMACGNCTMSCPTCFCVNTMETSSLDLTRSERWRLWDSCFNLNFTYIHGGPVRMSRQARYRHWLTHKFARWIDQFGETGCTGCGRCIRWCPAGIDPCEELESLANGSN
ncbi:MAG: 4Fe-4S dicluster domain-containing protein [Bryobacter sp.]|jgi:formate hydrogenlyase subunit 6/NADH:ubiquinone oxidoreductase subunit I|nr:4Fe-4S dicluster domain-containing protein [Bryobacter sp.]